MLKELHIQNFAIIQDLTIEFDPGLVVFTGETGAGKSIILDALSAALGERVEGSVIRKGSDRAVIEALFELDEHTRDVLNPILEAEGLNEEGNLLGLAREIRAEGRNIARVNGRSVNVALQSELGSFLVDLHGQSEHLSLLKIKHHIGLLDRFAHNEADLAIYKIGFIQLTKLEQQLKELQELEKTAQDRADMLKFQVQEISSANLKLDEEENLRQERTRLANAENLSSLGLQALTSLDEDNSEVTPATDLIGQVVHNLNELARIDPQMQSLAERADQALSGLADIAYELRNYLESIEFNPTRLDQIEERLNLLTLLKKKYGGSIESVLAHLDKAKLELNQVEHVEEQIKEVVAEISKQKIELALSADKISISRKQAAAVLTRGIETQLGKLQMKSAHFRVQIQQVEQVGGLPVEGRQFAFDNMGIDKVEFMIETNPGEGFKPLVKIASGGETSRLMLALKHVLAQADQIPTLVFDEIDSGIGGRVGITVGTLLWELAREHQVMCVTHLPQLAAFGDQHFHVTKQEQEGRTITMAKELTGEPRQRELASMIGPLSAGTLKSAEEILESASEITGKITFNRRK